MIAEQKLFQTLSGSIQEITAIFGTIPDFIVDKWVTDMLDDKAWDENTILTVIAEREQNPFTLKETVESLDADWVGQHRRSAQSESCDIIFLSLYPRHLLYTSQDIATLFLTYWVQ